MNEFFDSSEYDMSDVAWSWLITGTKMLLNTPSFSRNTDGI